MINCYDESFLQDILEIKLKKILNLKFMINYLNN